MQNESLQVLDPLDRVPVLLKNGPQDILIGYVEWGPIGFRVAEFSAPRKNMSRIATASEWFLHA